MRVAIIGGGISGLSTAYYIKQLEPASEVFVFEKMPRLGGTMQTENVGGFLFETGSNGFLSNKPDTLELVKASGAEELLLKSEDAARIRYLYTDALHQLPDNPKAFLTTKLLGVGDRLRVLGELFVPAKKDNRDESLQSFGYRRVGKAFTDTFLDAMAAGICASTPAKLSINAAFPAVVQLEKDFGGLFKGMIKKKRKEPGPGGVLMSFQGGVGSFIEHLGNTLDSKIYTDSEVTALEPSQRNYIVKSQATEVEVPKVVLATPAYVSSRLLEAIDGQIAEQLQAIEYSPIAVVGFGYDRLSHSLNGFGLLTTTSAGKAILGVLWDSSIFPDRAPEGKKSLRVMIGGQRNPELSLADDSTLIEIALKGIQETMGVDETPMVNFVKRWERGIPNYGLGHLAQVGNIMETLKTYPGLYLNSNAYYGIGLNDCVANSRKCAQRVVRD